MSQIVEPKDYQLAIDVQNGCNLSGVVFSFQLIMKKICNESNNLGFGTDWKNTHPISILFIDKMQDLTLKSNREIGNINAYARAYYICNRRSKMSYEELIKEMEIEIDQYHENYNLKII